MASSRPRGPSSWITIQGARQNNLKNVDVRIPRGVLTVVTGLSGSGKSSLAMDVLYAEGQRRYLEGVSAYARRFLERLPRPDVDRIEGLSPAVALEQRTASRSARSTVGTATEITDYLRLLFARVGTVVCPACRAPVPRWTLRRVAEAVAEGGERRLLVSFPHPSGAGARADLARRGHGRLVSGGAVIPLEAAPPGDATWRVLADRLSSRSRARLVEALEAAFREGEGTAFVETVGRDDAIRFRLGRVCVTCGRAFDEPTPQQFSFNSPAGACTTCRGFGAVLTFDPARIVPDPALSLAEGAIAPWARKWRTYFHRKLEGSARARRIPRRVPWRDLPPADREILLHGGDGFPGVIRFLERLASRSYKPGARFLVKRYQSPRRCTDCDGTRLQEAGRSVQLAGETLPGWCAWPVTAVRARIADLELSDSQRETVPALLADLGRRLEVLERIGLGYLSLNRPTRTLSGGEAQRIELAQALGTGLAGTLYVLDEPTIGLHPRDTGRLLEVLRDLASGGNTVVVVEHDRDIMRAADWMVDLGPGAGRTGGEVVFSGRVSERQSGPESATRNALAGADPRPAPAPVPDRGWIRLAGASLHNLKNLDVEFPWGTVTGVCGVSGSGKSSLVTGTLVPLLEEILRGQPGPTRGRAAPDRSAETGLGRLRVPAPLRGLRVVDQSPLARSTRSVPASTIGAWAPVRRLYAALPESRRRGYGPGTFSFNVAGGRCEACRGEGETTVDMDFMADVRLPCEACRGRRFSAPVLEVTYRGLSIADVLDLTVAEAMVHFRGQERILAPLWWMERVGLGYLTLGQPAAALSGGEAQRLKLVRELAAGSTGNLLVLDEPTVGLHPEEVTRLVNLLHAVVQAGNSVVVIEHHPELLAACHWLIELGPEGGEAGGRLLAAGPPEDLAAEPGSVMAPFLPVARPAGRG